MFRVKLQALGVVPWLHGAVARLFACLWHAREAMCLVSLVLLATAAFGQTYYNISTFAGVWLPENLPGASVSLNQIGGVGVDAAGNVFLSLPAYAAVMRLDAATGILTCIAGNGTNGFSGDNGPAAGAQLYSPHGLALDPEGNLYIADTGNRRVRKVTNGIITTVAGNGGADTPDTGGIATSYELQYPYSIGIDSAGNLYIYDEDGIIHEVTNGVITGVAGTQGYFGGIAVDTAGSLYLLDGSSVLKVSNGVATTFAGNGTYGFSGDGGPATAAQLGGDTDGDTGPSGIAVDSMGNVYIADTFNGRIRKVSNGIITTVAGGSSATQLTAPTFIAVDSAGALYISDPLSGAGVVYGDRIRKIANGVAATIAGNGFASYSGDNGPAANAQFNQPGGVAVDSAGRVYIADTQNNCVRMIANGVVTTVAGNGTYGFSGDNGPATGAQLATPVAAAVDSAGNLYIADINNSRIRKVSGGVITTVAGTAGYTPWGVAADSAGNVYVSDSTYGAPSRLLKVANGNATTLPGYGTGLALDPAGNLYMTNFGAILELSNGVVTTIGGGTGVAFDAAGNGYIADGHLGLVRKLSNGTITALPMIPPLVFPGDPSRTDSSGNTYDANTDANNPFVPPAIAADSSGNIYSSDGAHILVLKPAGAIAPPPTTVSVDFVNNAASNQFLGIAPGEIVTLKGSGLGPTQLVSAGVGSGGSYPTQLSGTSVQFNGVAAPLLYTSATQVLAVAPYGVTGPAVSVTATYQDQASVPATIQVFAAAAGLFTADGTGAGQAAAINQDGTINSASNPAPLGSVISLYATGGGQTLPAGVDGQVSAPPLAGQSLPVVASTGPTCAGSTCVGGPQRLQYAGPAPGEIAGLMQINVLLTPLSVQPGSAVPVAIIVGPAGGGLGSSISQSNVTIAVR